MEQYLEYKIKYINEKKIMNSTTKNAWLFIYLKLYSFGKKNELVGIELEKNERQKEFVLWEIAKIFNTTDFIGIKKLFEKQLLIILKEREEEDHILKEKFGIYNLSSKRIPFEGIKWVHYKNFIKSNKVFITPITDKLYI